MTDQARDEAIRTATVGELQPHDASIVLAEYDPGWPRLYDREAARIQSALGDRVRLLEHVGSTAVPGLVAKSRIDVLLIVPDSADEPAYVPAMEAAGYVLRIREPGWYEHRVFKGPDTDVNVHVFSPGCPEIARMLMFRDWLRTHDADRSRYGAAKRDLARSTWHYVQDYADAKTAVVESILAAAGAPGPWRPPEG